MKPSKPTSTALARILALPLMAGLLAGCDYASKLPDAPTTLGYELQGPKPPSVTAEPALPPAPDLMQTASAPPPGALGRGLDTRALQVSPQGIEVPRSALALPPSPDLPVPGMSGSAGSLAQVGMSPVDQVGPFPMPDADGYTAPSMSYQVADTMASDPDGQFPEYAPVPFDSMAEPPAMIQPVGVASLPAQPSYEPMAYEAPQSTVLYDPSVGAEPLPYGGSIGQDTFVATAPIATTPMVQPLPTPVAPPSPITVLHSRLDNGAVVKVHPVVGAPGATSMTLARTIASELGATVDATALAFAPAVFDLRASASPSGSQAAAEWKLFSANGALVGTFPESHSSGSWGTMGEGELRSMGRRVADRLRRNADLRRATLTSLASAPPITSIDYSAVLPSGAPSLAPVPRQRPVRATLVRPVQAAPAPIRTAMIQPVAPMQPAPAQPRFVVNTEAMQPTDPLANAVPRRRPENVRMAALAPVSPPPAALAPQPIQPVAPLPPIERVSAPSPIAPLGAALPAAPLAAPSAPPAPSFDTLRASADGPRALVFRGVRGAPGNGDQALGREVSRLLGQSGANLSPNGTPNALYLTADVSRTRNGGSDSIKILWHVEEADGTRVGQVVQENDVPAGALDANWGEDAFYAAQGARDGIMELLRTSGAIDA